MEYALEELMPIVKKLSEKYTGRESSSITYETAQMLLKAVMYCIDERAQEAAIVCEWQNASDAYAMGYEMVMNKTKQANKLFSKISIEFCDYGNLACHETVIEGMPAFFLRYDARFSPQNTLLTLDYPLLLPVKDVSGIDAIYGYLKCIQLEQTFLKKFSMERITTVLKSYHEEYKDLFINLCSIVLRNILGCMILHKSEILRPFSDMEEQEIITFAGNYAKPELEQILCTLIEKMVQTGYGEDADLYQYLILDVPEYASWLKR